MKLSVLFILAFFLGGNQFNGNIPSGDDVKTTIQWSETIHDFGNVKFNDPAAVDFTFTNNGDEPAIITSVKASCGCTATDYTKEPVMPGKTGKVTVTYNSKREGTFSKTVSVFFQGKEQAETLIIKGVVESNPQPTQ